MTHDEITRMAQESGFPFNKYGALKGDEYGEIDADEMFERFAALVAAAEREACAKALEAAPPRPKLSDERILHHLDAILKASGSGLKNYSMHKTIEEMKQAFRAVEREILGGSEK